MASKNWKFSIRRFAIAWINGKEKGERKNRKWKKKKAAMKTRESLEILSIESLVRGLGEKVGETPMNVSVSRMSN